MEGGKKKRRRISKLSLKYRPSPPPSLPPSKDVSKPSGLFIVKKKKDVSSPIIPSTQIHLSPSPSSPSSFISPTQLHIEDNIDNNSPVNDSNDFATTTTSTTTTTTTTIASPTILSPTQKSIIENNNIDNNNNINNYMMIINQGEPVINNTPKSNNQEIDRPKKQLGDGPMDGLYWRCEYCGNLVPQSYTTFNSKILEKRIKHYKKCAEGIKPKDLQVQKSEDLAMELLLSNNTTTSDEAINDTSDENKNKKTRNVFDILMASTSGSPISSSSSSSRLNSHNSGVKHYVKKNAFALMMSKKKPNQQNNKETNLNGKRTNGKYKNNKKWNRRFANTSRDPNMCPHYKLIKLNNNKIQPIVVDGFQYASREQLSQIYFLSHFHSDHYIGLKKTFDDGIIYCTQVTANLLLRQFKIKPENIRALPLDRPVKLDITPNIVTTSLSVADNNSSSSTTTSSSSLGKKLQVIVTLIDANHCPGSCIMLFQIGNKSPYRYLLHTGDFRYTRSMRSHPAMKDIKHLECLYLDTTYCNPKYDFPPQIKAIESSLNALERHGAGSKNMRKDTLFLFGSYSIGKERIFMACAKKFNVKIYVTSTKFNLIKCFNWRHDDMKYITRDVSETSFHVVSMGLLNFKRIGVYLASLKKKYKRVVAIRPTGWSFGGGRYGGGGRRNSSSSNNNNNSMYEGISSVHTTRVNNLVEVTIFGIAYSEHSSFSELQQCVRDFKPFIIKPTVNAYTKSAEEQMLLLLGS